MSQQPLLAQRYQIEATIGDGGMGVVYKAFDTRLKRHMAIKQLKQEVVDEDDSILERFRREAQALRQLNHPNIIRVMGLFEENNNHYIVMEYVSAGSLLDELQVTNQLSLERTLAISLELSDALARAHHLNIIHRDIKPANVLIADDGSPRLTDFGIARIGNRSRVTQAHSVLGTLAYLSPEALDGRDLDARTDIWAFGVLIYKMLTGVLPFDDSTSSGMIMAIFTKPAPPIHDLRPDVPPALIDLLERMLEKDVNKRINSTRQVGAELHAIINHQLITPVSSVSLGTDSTILLNFLDEVRSLVTAWDSRAQEAQRVLKNATDGQTLYYQRAISNTYKTVVTEMRAILKNMESVASGQGESYADVSREDVEDLLRKAGMRFKDLYEDNGYIFTVIFPKISIIPMHERVDKLRNIAPQFIELESGKLPDSGEPYLDFAFDSPL